MKKLEEVKCKGIQYMIMKIDELDAAVPVVELETVGEPLRPAVLTVLC